MEQGCSLCRESGGEVVWRGSGLRVVLADEADYPGFCRVILERHAAEMTDLSATERATVMQAVFAVEAVLRELLEPHKINLASFGNVVAHVHWHVIPRFADDRHFPSPVWATAQREARPRTVDLPELKARLAARLDALK